ncbi:MAG TPA: DUF6056 family protein, partial [Anaerolineales bacterium]|nr:DUF6056 family protein [Anaerolineales bacterium]
LAIMGLVILGLATNLFAFRSPAFYFLIAGLVGAIVGLIVLVIAPGNAIRQEYFHRSTISTALHIALKAYWALLASWFRGVKGIVGLLAIGLCGVLVGMQTQQSGKYDFRYGSIFILFGALLAFCCFLPAAYSISASTPERALIIPAYCLITGILAGSYFWGQGLYGRFGDVSNIKVAVSTVLFLFLVVVSSWNVLSLYSSRSVFIQYAQQWDQAHTYILTEKNMGKSKVRIAAKQNWASLGEPRNKPGFWLNTCMSDYYGIQVLAPAPDQP